MVTQHVREPEVADDLPIQEVPRAEWDAMVAEANELCALADRHLDYEARGRMLVDRSDFLPSGLCPEQRAQYATDLYAQASR